MALFLVVGAALGADALTRQTPASSFDPTLSNEAGPALEMAEPTKTPEPTETPEATETPEPTETPEATDDHGGASETSQPGDDHDGSSGDHGSGGD